MFGEKRIAELEKEWKSRYRILLATYEALKSDFKFMKDTYEREMMDNPDLEENIRELQKDKAILKISHESLRYSFDYMVNCNKKEIKELREENKALQCLLTQATKRADDLDDKLYEIKKVVGVNND